MSTRPTSRPLLIFVSDLHLTDHLEGPAIPPAVTFSRFWQQIEAARGDAPAHLVLGGDVFDLVRSPSWLDTPHRPYHEPSPGVVGVVDRIVDGILAREAGFLERIRARVQAGALRVHYLLGNHDRLLAHAPATRRRIWRALTGADHPVDLPDELVFPDHGVLAYHGHTTDLFCSEPDGRPPIGDAIATELIMRFPRELRALLGRDLPALDDIDDVRPVFAVPSWVRHYAVREKGILRSVQEVWSALVEDFLGLPFTRDWLANHRGRHHPEGGQLKLLLQLSTGRIMRRTKDHRLTQLYRFFQHLLDGRFARRAAERLQAAGDGRLRYAVNGHSHFASMVPLGQVGGRPACYFNTGTWRTVHQLGQGPDGRAAFLPYGAMTYLAFFPDGDRLGRDFEWWTGAQFSRRDG